VGCGCGLRFPEGMASHSTARTTKTKSVSWDSMLVYDRHKLVHGIISVLIKNAIRQSDISVEYMINEANI
jgi:hypothetical protein